MLGEVASPITPDRVQALRRRLALHDRPGYRCRCLSCSSDRSELICSGTTAYSAREVTSMSDLPEAPTAAEEAAVDATAEEESDDAIGDDAP